MDHENHHLPVPLCRVDCVLYKEILGIVGCDLSSISVAEYRKLYKPKRKNAVKRKKTGVGSTKESGGEQTLSLHLKSAKIEFEKEFKFCAERKWRADFHITGKMILVEVEGGIWSNGRHTRGKGYIADMEKYNTAQNLGYRVLRYSTEQVMSGVAIKQIENLVRGGL